MSNIEEKESCEKNKEDLFAKEKQEYQQYVNGLENQVFQLAMRDPKKYKKYQEIGSSYMGCSYDLKVGVDEEVDQINAKRLLYNIRDYNLENDLIKEEIDLLIRVYGDDWKSKIDNLS
jgi:hypothetical protein